MLQLLGLHPGLNCQTSRETKTQSRLEMLDSEDRLCGFVFVFFSAGQRDQQLICCRDKYMNKR